MFGNRKSAGSWPAVGSQVWNCSVVPLQYQRTSLLCCSAWFFRYLTPNCSDCIQPLSKAQVKSAWAKFCEVSVLTMLEPVEPRSTCPAPASMFSSTSGAAVMVGRPLIVHAAPLLPSTHWPLTKLRGLAAMPSSMDGPPVAQVRPTLNEPLRWPPLSHSPCRFAVCEVAFSTE